MIGVLTEMASGPHPTLDENWPQRTIEVLNKADLLGGAAAVPGADAANSVVVSALTGEGLDALRGALDARLAAGMETVEYAIPPADGARLAWLYQHGEVLTRADSDDTIRLTVRLSPADRARFEQS